MTNKPEIVAYISTHMALARKGKSWWGICPFHKEKTPSFSVDQKKQVFFCFGCGAGGDVIEFAKRLYDTNFNGACRHLGIGDKPKTRREKRQAAREIARQKKEMAWRQVEQDRADTIDRWRWGRVAWLDRKICAINEIKPMLRDESDLEGMGFFYNRLPLWEHELDCLLFNDDVEGFYNAING